MRWWNWLINTAVIVALLLALSVVFAVYPTEICEKAKGSEQEYCTLHSVGTGVLIRILQFLDDWNAVILSLATVCIAGFTLTLKGATDKLWSESKSTTEKLISMVGAMGESLQESKRATAAMEGSSRAAGISAALAEQTLIATNRPWIKIFNVEQNGRIYEEDGLIRIGATFHAQNVGNSPAVRIKTFAHPVFAKADDERISDIVSRECGNVAQFWSDVDRAPSLFPNDERTYTQNGGSRPPTGFEFESHKRWILIGISYDLPIPGLSEPKFTISLYEIEWLPVLHGLSAVMPPQDGNRRDFYGTATFKEIGSHVS